MCGSVINFTSCPNISGVSDNKTGYDVLDNHDEVMGSYTLRTVEKTIQCGVVPTLFVIGAPANVISMIVFWRQGVRDPMNLCLFCLAFVDLMYGLALCIMSSYCLIGQFVPSQEAFWKVTLMKYAIYFVYSFAYSSGCLTMIISMERCVCVMLPMKAATLISTQTMAIIIVTTIVFIHVLCGVYVAREEVVFVKVWPTEEILVILGTTEFYLAHSFLRIIDDIVLSLVSFCSFVVVFLTTSITIVGLQHAMTWRKSTASSSLKGQTALVRMLVVVSCIYILSAGPLVALALARFTVPAFRSDGLYANLFFATHVIGTGINMFNSSINFFVYATMSSRFRHELKTLFFCVTNVHACSRLLKAESFDIK